MSWYKFSVDIVEDDVILEVSGTYSPGDPGVHTFPNGDPGYPPTGPEVDIEKIMWKDDNGNDANLLPLVGTFIDEDSFYEKVEEAIESD